MGNTIEENSTELIGDIQNLQNIELDLFNTLEKGIANNTLTADDKTTIVDQINKVSEMRIKSFANLNTMNLNYQGGVSSASNVITHQISALNVVENELNGAKNRLKSIDEERNNKLRLVEINTYYGEKYANHTSIMKTVVYFCIPIILLTILANMNIIPSSIYSVLIIIIAVWAIVAIGSKLMHSMSHDNMNYQEYTWRGQSPPSSPTVDTGDSGGKNPWFTIGASCVAQECCDDGYTYVPSPTNKCVANTNLPEDVSPYNPSQAVSSTDASGLTSAAPGLTPTASQSVASVYSSLSGL
jgi:hypothetical protein